MQLPLKLGYILNYNPKTLTVDIKDFDGTVYTDVILSSGLAVFSTPVLPIVSGNSLIKSGSLVLFTKVLDTTIIVIKLFNDDLDISVNGPKPNMRPFNGKLNDLALELLKDGELLLQAPGVIDTQLLQRVPGALIALKNDGQMLLSNSNGSASMYFDNNSKINIACVAADINGRNTRMYEDDDGILHLEAHVGNIPVSKINLNSDGTLSIESDSDMTIDGSSVNINSGTKGAARVDDEVKSTIAEDLTFWQYWATLSAQVAALPITVLDGGATFKAGLVALFASIPNSLTGKITKGSEDVKIGGDSK